MADTASVQTTPLHRLHQELGGRLVAFAGWELPIHYDGVLAEHRACRTGAALFDVSHMGIVELRPPPGGDVAAVADALETVTPAAVTTLEPGRQRYGVLTTDDGGIIDDLIVTHRHDHLMVVVNASRRHIDLDHLRRRLADRVAVVERTDLALVALQGPRAVDALERLTPAARAMVFLDFASMTVTLDDGPVEVGVSRSGYTGEDGFELMVPADRVEAVARALLAQPEVVPAGLGARDTLRLEAGLPLYGNDLDETTSPIEAGLAWTVPKRRRADARFPGAERVLAELADGPGRRRVGLQPSGRRPVRHGATLRTAAGDPAGVVTSGGFGPSVDRPVAMGYVAADLAATGTLLVADVRGSDVDVTVADLPFSPHHYHRGA